MESRLNKTILPPQEFHRIQTSLHEQGHHHPQGSESRWLILVWATRCLRLDVSFWTRCHFRLGPVLLPGSGAATFLSNKDGRALGTAGQNLFSLRVASCWTGLESGASSTKETTPAWGLAALFGLASSVKTAVIVPVWDL
jgi:hypothetical protein